MMNKKKKLFLILNFTIIFLPFPLPCVSRIKAGRKERRSLVVCLGLLALLHYFYSAFKVIHFMF